MTAENQKREVSCPYCESKFKDRIELSKHIDGVHTGLGLLEGNTKRWWDQQKQNKQKYSWAYLFNIFFREAYSKIYLNGLAKK
jgi:uncharacterized C2H2 Zn-finger protein